MWKTKRTKGLSESKSGRPSKVDSCINCGKLFNSHLKGRVYWIEYYEQNKRLKRERIGSNKAAAGQRLREVLKARAEGRYIRKSPDIKTTIKDLVEGYMKSPKPKIRDREAYNRDIQGRLNRLLLFFGDRPLKDITHELEEEYRQKRLSEPSGRNPGNLTKPATVNRELACLKVLFNWAKDNGRAESYPFKKGHMLKENNERNRILSPDEYNRLMSHSPAHLQPIIKLAYYSAMRQGEILKLTWGKVDLKEDFIRLMAEDTKANEGR